ncbi:MAG: hypothetical protein AAFR58_11090 [Cyanobacteria bacterium J06627_28]
MAPESEVDPADACIRTVCELSAPRLLSESELSAIAQEIPSGQTLIEDQSFALTLPVIGRADFIAAQDENNDLLLSLRTDSNEYETLYQSVQWQSWDVKAVAFEDIHQDGDGPDIVVIADYVTGIGPTGAQPFSVAHILFNRGDDSFQSDFSVDQILSDREANTVSEVIETAQSEGLVRGLQYREGPI